MDALQIPQYREWYKYAGDSAKTPRALRAETVRWPADRRRYPRAETSAPHFDQDECPLLCKQRPYRRRQVFLIRCSGKSSCLQSQRCRSSSVKFIPPSAPRQILTRTRHGEHRLAIRVFGGINRGSRCSSAKLQICHDGDNGRGTDARLAIVEQL